MHPLMRNMKPGDVRIRRGGRWSWRWWLKTAEYNFPPPWHEGVEFTRDGAVRAARAAWECHLDSLVDRSEIVNVSRAARP